MEPFGVFFCFPGVALGPAPGRVALVWLTKAFVSGFGCGVFGPDANPFLVWFWAVWGRRAPVFRCFEGFALVEPF